MTRFHKVNDERIQFTPEEEIARDVEEAAWASKRASYNATQKHRDDRKAEYPPIGDQIDAIWKELERQRTGGATLEADADAMLGKILAVKAKYPKPGV